MLKGQLKNKMDAQSAILNLAITENRALTTEEQTQFNNLETEIKNLEATIKAQDTFKAREGTPVNEPIWATPASNEGIKVFKNFGEQLKAIKDATTGGKRDPRLDQLNNEFKNASGANEGVGSEGGFAVQTDFAGLMMSSAAKAGQILPLLDQYEVGAGANSVKWVDIEETSVASTVFGGIQTYWAAEAAAVTATKPKLVEKELKLEKLMGIAYATMELEEDSGFISSLYEKGFTLAIQRALEEAVISGNGNGKPLGLINSGSKVEIAKENNQTAGTVLWENISKMHNRLLNKDVVGNPRWLVHPDVADQLDFLNFPVGTGGVPVYLPATQEGALTQLKGKGIIESDFCSAVGSVGDIIFTNLFDYMLITKGGIRKDTSIHVQFLTGENCFRFIFRANGMPKKNKTTSIKNSSNARSNIITLAARG